MINRRRSGAPRHTRQVNATAGLEASEGVNSASVSDGSHESVGSPLPQTTPRCVHRMSLNMIWSTKPSYLSGIQVLFSLTLLSVPSTLCPHYVWAENVEYDAEGFAPLNVKPVP
jgi:hypothetical protein